MAVDTIVQKSREVLTRAPKAGPKKRSARKDPVYLPRINSPEDLRKIPIAELPVVAQEIRDLLLDTVSQHGGHLAPSLGAVELAIALHYCYDTPRDHLVWDVGHQAYAHKVLTGRRDQFGSLRQQGGISGFPRAGESPYDTASTGHASTSISTGMGLAIARDLLKQQHEVVAIIGDGSLSGGLAFEGLNNLGAHTDLRMTVVLNDNRMSISRNVGALSRYLTRVITDRRFNRIRGEIWQLLGRSDVGKRIREVVHSVDEIIKHSVIPGKLFEDMGLRYFGPVDGHNIAEMAEIFRFIKSAPPHPSLVHVITTKGKGYDFAENDATKFHGVSRFSLSTGTVVSTPSRAPSFSEVFGKTLVQIARSRPDVVAITAAMPDGTGLSSFRNDFPARFFDVGIAEEHALSFAAGLARKGLTPVVAIYSTFLQRAYDQLIHDIALDNLHVVVCVDRAGLVGEDGPTHHGVFDLSFLRTVPNAVIMAPRNEVELRTMLNTAVTRITGPAFIRYPRGAGTGGRLDQEFAELPLYQPEELRRGRDCAIVAAGHACVAAEEACLRLANSDIDATLINARFVKPLDEAFYRGLLGRHPLVVTVEHNTVTGGFGSGLLELASTLDLQRPSRIACIGIPDRFIEHGAMDSLHAQLGMDAEGICAKMRELLGKDRNPVDG